MNLRGQTILPAIRKIRDIELMVKHDYEYAVLLDVHLGQVSAILKWMQREGKHVLLHADLIQGLKNDVYAAEFLCQQFQPAGIISTRADTLITAKKHKILAIQRIFLLDTIALETSYNLARKVIPDFIEVLPGVIPHLIQEVKQETGKPVIAGGLIKTTEDVRRALEAGAEAITTSHKSLWAL